MISGIPAMYSDKKRILVQPAQCDLYSTNSRNNLNSGRAKLNVRRRAAALTELAIVLPVIVLVVMGTIETCSVLFLKQALRIAAFEGARVALVPGSALSNVEAGCNQILSMRNVQGATITVSPADFPSRPYGTVLSVRVAAPCAANSLFAPWLFANRTVTGQLHVMLER